jgi:hypothetical protein
MNSCRGFRPKIVTELSNFKELPTISEQMTGFFKAIFRVDVGV